jgi:hypothetical protein
LGIVIVTLSELGVGFGSTVGGGVGSIVWVGVGKTVSIGVSAGALEFVCWHPEKRSNIEKRIAKLSFLKFII